jgi:hypothetical protein
LPYENGTLYNGQVVVAAQAFSVGCTPNTPVWVDSNSGGVYVEVYWPTMGWLAP